MAHLETDTQWDGNETLGKVFVVLVCGLICWVCIIHCCNASLQHRSASFPSVAGRMTEYYWNDFGTAGETELIVEYNYAVNGQRYFGHRKRFSWRHFESESKEAVALARSWTRPQDSTRVGRGRRSDAVC